jgi:hypothetical protein
MDLKTLETESLPARGGRSLRRTLNGAQPRYQHFNKVLIAWAEAYRKLRAEEWLALPSWAAAERLIRSGESLDQYARQHLRGALAHSDEELAPLRDPLALNLGEHRWLSSDREESYSDWLAWTLQGFAGAAEILPLLGINEQKAIDELAKMKHVVWREGVSEYGRTDIEVRFGARGLLVLEIKTRSPDPSLLLEQLKRYERRAEVQRARPKLFAYVGPEAPAQDISPFLFTPWQALCSRLRRYARRLKESDPMRAAAVLIFCGAVEQNLLGISAHPQRFRAMATVDYLKRWPEGDYER